MVAKATSAPPEDDGILRIGGTVEEPKYDVLFRLGGKDCRGLANPPASMMLGYMDQARKRGTNTAISWLLEEILDGPAYEALTTDPGLSRRDWQAVCDLVLGLLFGSGDAGAVPKARRSGTRRTGG